VNLVVLLLARAISCACGNDSISVSPGLYPLFQALSVSFCMSSDSHLRGASADYHCIGPFMVATERFSKHGDLCCQLEDPCNQLEL